MLRIGLIFTPFLSGKGIRNKFLNLTLSHGSPCICSGKCAIYKVLTALLMNVRFLLTWRCVGGTCGLLWRWNGDSFVRNVAKTLLMVTVSYCSRLDRTSSTFGFIHSINRLSYDRSKVSSKASDL